MPNPQDALQKSLGSTYHIEGELSGGGMSRVFVAEERAFGRKVVIKLLSPDLAAGVSADRFEREIQLAAKLQHPHIVPVLTAGDSEGLPYYTMPFIEGESLRAKLSGEGRLDVAETLAILRDVARALDYAHARGIVHRDIKPDNILLSRGTATVADFGIAKALTASRTREGNASLTHVGVSIGTPAYMAPEQAAGDADVDQRADIYAFGCMAYEMLTGRAVFTASSPQRAIAAHMGERPQPITELRRDLPAPLASLVMQCLAKDPDERPRDAAALLEAIEAASHGDRTPVSVGRALLLYGAAFVAVAIIARAAMISFGLPDWLFYGALAIMALGVPAVAVTRNMRWTWYAVGAFALLLAGTATMHAAGVGPFRTLLGTGALAKGDRILVDEFTVANTADTVLGRAISEGVRSDLGQYAGIRLVTDERIARTLESMDKPGTTRLTFDVAREVGTRAGARGIVDGLLTPVGTGYLVVLRLVSADSGRELARVSDAANTPSELIPIVGKLTQKLRGKMGESLKSVRESIPLALARTSSLPALRKYTEAVSALKAGRPDDFRRLMREAIATDTTFAAAYMSLANANMNEEINATENEQLLGKAIRYRDRVPEDRRYWLDEMFFRQGPRATRNADSAAAARRRGYEHFPDAGNTNSAAGDAMLDGNYELADSLYRRSAAMDTLYEYPVSNLLYLQMQLGKRAAAESSFKAVFKRKSTGASMGYQLLYQFVRGDTAGMLAAAQRGYDSAGAGSEQRMDFAGFVEGFHRMRGELSEADHWLGKYLMLAKATDRKTYEMDFGLYRAMGMALLVGDTLGARKLIDSVVTNVFPRFDSLDRSYLTLISANVAAGRIDQAKAAMRELEKLNVGKRDLSIVRGELAIAEKRWDDALREGALPPGDRFLQRAMAYDGRGDRDSALVNYERFANALVPNYEKTPLVLRRLGELYESKGDLSKAISWYRRFADLWRNADPVLQPQVADVKKRIARLEAAEARGR